MTVAMEGNPSRYSVLEWMTEQYIYCQPPGLGILCYFTTDRDLSCVSITGGVYIKGCEFFF